MTYLSPQNFGIGNGDTLELQTTSVTIGSLVLLMLHPTSILPSCKPLPLRTLKFHQRRDIGCWLLDPIKFYIGRRGTIFVSAISCLIAPIGGAITRTCEVLFITRIFMGIGMGPKGACTSFAAENSPPAARGALPKSWQTSTAFGTFLGLCQSGCLQHW